MHRTAALALAIALGGCATQFYGSPKVEKGPAGCKSACDAWGMELAGMVKMGEYSDGCICQVKSTAAPAQSGRGVAIPAAAAEYVQMQVAAAQEAADQSRGTGQVVSSPIGVH